MGLLSRPCRKETRRTNLSLLKLAGFHAPMSGWFPDDQRRILTCSTTPQSTLRVEWLAPAAPGVDSRWEMQLFGLVRTGEQERAIQFLRESRGMSRKDAAKKVAAVAAEFGILHSRKGQ